MGMCKVSKATIGSELAIFHLAQRLPMSTATFFRQGRGQRSCAAYSWACGYQN